MLCLHCQIGIVRRRVVPFADAFVFFDRWLELKFKLASYAKDPLEIFSCVVYA